MKSFADKSSIFTRVFNVIATHNTLSNDLRNIELRVHQWKMLCNPDISKQAIEIVILKKSPKTTIPCCR